MSTKFQDSVLKSRVGTTFEQPWLHVYLGEVSCALNIQIIPVSQKRRVNEWPFWSLESKKRDLDSIILTSWLLCLQSFKI